MRIAAERLNGWLGLVSGHGARRVRVAALHGLVGGLHQGLRADRQLGRQTERSREGGATWKRKSNWEKIAVTNSKTLVRQE